MFHAHVSVTNETLGAFFGGRSGQAGAIALARTGLEARPGHQADPATVAPQQAVLLQRRQNDVEALTAATEQCGQTCLS